MNRKRFIRQSSFAAFALALSGNKSLAAVIRAFAPNVQMLDKRTGIFTERGGTILFSITRNGIVVVDSQFPETAVHFLEELRKRSDKEIALLINTHHHGDHSSGNIAFTGMTKHVLAHENSAANQRAVAVKNKTEEKQLYPDQTYSTIWEQPMGDETVTLHYFGAGHTNGDSYVRMKKSKVVHCGDLVFNRRHPVVDRSAGASISNWIRNLEQAVSFFPARTKYICGHAAEGYSVIIGKADVLLFRTYLRNLLAFASDSILARMTKDDFLKHTEVPGSPEWKGDAKRALEAAWDEMTTSR